MSPTEDLVEAVRTGPTGRPIVIRNEGEIMWRNARTARGDRTE